MLKQLLTACLLFCSAFIGAQETRAVINPAGIFSQAVFNHDHRPGEPGAFRQLIRASSSTQHFSSLPVALPAHSNAVSNTASATCRDSSYTDLFMRQDYIFYVNEVIPLRDGGYLVGGAQGNSIQLPLQWFPFLMRFNEDGSLQWTREYRDTVNYWFSINRVMETSSGNIIATGELDYKDTSRNSYTYHTAMMKLAADGSLLWGKTIDTRLASGATACKNNAALAISSISEGKNEDIILAGTSNTCSDPMYETVLLVNTGGSLKWDANYMHASLPTQGAAAFQSGNDILAVGTGGGVYTGSDNISNIHFLRLDYVNGQVISTAAFHADTSYPQSMYESFTNWNVQARQLANGHLAVYGKLFSSYTPVPGNNGQFGMLEFDASLQFINGYTINADVKNFSNATSYYNNNITVDAAGNALVALFRLLPSNSAIVYYGTLVNGHFIKSKKVTYNNVNLYGNNSLATLSDGAHVFLQNRNSADEQRYYIDLRRYYDSDTSHSLCLGTDTSFATVSPLRYVPYDHLNIDHSLYQQVYYIRDKKDVAVNSYLQTPGCSAVSICDTIKIHGKASFCGPQPGADFTAYKNNACGSGVAWLADTTSGETIVPVNDTAIHINFHKDFHGYLYANLSGSACSLTVKDSLLINVQLSNSSLNLGNDTLLCKDNPILLQAGFFATYAWQDGSTQPGFTVTTPGQYYVTVKDFCGVSFSDTIRVTAAPEVNFSAGDDMAVCPADTLVLQCTSGFDAYSWMEVNGKVDSTRILKLQAPAQGNYIASAQRWPGCTLRDTVMVLVKETPALQLPADTLICAGTVITLDAGQGFETYEWNTHDATEQLQVHNAGSYNVRATAANGCTVADTILVTQRVPDVLLNLGPDLPLCKNIPDTVHLAGFASYVWQDGAASATRIITTPGLYMVTATDNHGCLQKDSLQVFQKDCDKKIWFPSAFTPNHDARNDVFKPAVNGALYAFRMIIYNRFGQAVYETQDAARGWDGTVNGKPQPTGSYVWVCHYRFAGTGSEMQTEKGSLVLIH